MPTPRSIRNDATALRNIDNRHPWNVSFGVDFPLPLSSSLTGPLVLTLIIIDGWDFVLSGILLSFGRHSSKSVTDNLLDPPIIVVLFSQ